jgi:AcrR family transcriptional regulator
MTISIDGERDVASRADSMRLRIVKAAIALHESIGPSKTTISSIAAGAGVQRLTVYRQFPDRPAVLQACWAYWNELHPLPSPETWEGIESSAQRLGTALQELYSYFRDGASMLSNVLRDESEILALRMEMAPWHNRMREVAASLSAGWGAKGKAQRLVRAAVEHALRFETWRSLSAAELSVEQATTLMVRLAEGAARPA